MKILAFDFGASSGRAILGDFDGKKVVLTEIHRFLNEPVEINGILYWDILRLFHELKTGILKADKLGGAESMAIDTWGVDFGLLDKKGNLLNNPFHYRHSHTENAIEELFKTMSKEEIYKETGLAFMKFNSLCQINSMKRDENVALKNAESFLFIPDLFNYFLTGIKATESTIASTSQLKMPGRNEWNENIFNAYNIDKKLFSKIVEPGTCLGKLKDEIKKELGLKNELKVLTTASHDTASAYVAVPCDGRNAAFLSSGTWSLLGAEIDKPILNMNAMGANYTNEGGLNSSIRFLKNIMGLWIIQECKRTWDKQGEVLSFAELAKGAEEIEPCKFIINPDSSEFYSPNDMPNKIINFCKKTNQGVPKTKFEIARTIFDSLALTYKHNILALETLQNKKIEVLHIVGGGCNNDLLNKATANALGFEVTAGPSEGTALGNILTQLIGLKAIKDVAEAREIVKNSTQIKTYQSNNTEVYAKAYEKFKTLANN